MRETYCSVRKMPTVHELPNAKDARRPKLYPGTFQNTLDFRHGLNGFVKSSVLDVEPSLQVYLDRRQLHGHSQGDEVV